MVFLCYLFSRCTHDDWACADVLLQKNRNYHVPGFAGAAFFYAQLLPVYLPVYGCYQPLSVYRFWNAGHYPQMEVF